MYIKITLDWNDGASYKYLDDDSCEKKVQKKLK